MDWDVFISHAWEDKESFVRPLAEALKARGLRVWYDEFTIAVGDSLRRSIDHGLANSRYGIVVLSPSFFAKEWPQKELDGLTTREVNGEKVILPIWHQIDAPLVRKYSPTLADRVAVPASRGLEYVITELLRAMRISPNVVGTQEETTHQTQETARMERRQKERETREAAVKEGGTLQAQTELARERTGKQIADWLVQLAQAKSRDDWNKVIELGECILELDANHHSARDSTVDAYRIRGENFHDAHDYDRAIADLNRAIEIDPLNPSYYHQRGVNYHEKSEYDTAISDFTRAIELEPNTASFYYCSRGRSYHGKQDYAQAISNFNIAIKLTMAKETDMKRKEALAKTPDEADTYRLLIRLLNVDYVHCYYGRGLSYQMAGNRNAAFADFTRAANMGDGRAREALAKL